jgi:hypothetical protein
VDLEAQLTRFPSRHRDRVRRCAAVSKNVGQLAYTFPVLLHALAVEYGPSEARLAAIELIELGCPLADVAASIGLPLCLRRLPPEACRDSLSWAPCSPDFTRLLANHLPTSVTAMPNWLSAVFYAAHVCDEQFAGWIARQQILMEDADFAPSNLLPLALFAWHSQRSDNRLRRLAFNPWSSRVSYKTAVVEAKHWLNRVKLLVYLADQPIVDAWLDAAKVCGFEFVPLRSVEHIINERLAMRNCVDGYADKLAFNRCRLFSVRHLGERVALLELVPSQENPSIPRLAQLKGPENSEVASEVRRAVSVWLRRQRHQRIADQTEPSANVTSLKLYELLLPYSSSIQNRCSSGATTPLITLAQLDSSLVELARIGGVSGWPFSRRI